LLPASVQSDSHDKIAMSNGPDSALKRDYSETLFLPRTEFPMRAGLPQPHAAGSHTGAGCQDPRLHTPG
jgi:hypothetical protein